jgi:DNA-binding MarR family transcriptional regulator
MPARKPLPFDPIAEARRQWERHGWAAAAPGMAAVTSIQRVQQIFQGRVDAALAPHGLTFARYEVLALLSFTRTGALPLGKIGSRLQVHPASVTNAIDRLEQQRLVRRVPNPTDGRGTLAEITDDGRRVHAAATVALNAVFESTGLTVEQLDTLVGLLERVRAASGDFVTPPAARDPVPERLSE